MTTANTYEIKPATEADIVGSRALGGLELTATA